MNFIPVSNPHFCGNEKQYLNQCIDTGWISSEGPFVGQFEQEFSESCNRKFGVAVSSGSAALEVAMNALEIKPGDEVIVPTFTIISCVTPIVRLGAVPVLVDCEQDSWNMDCRHIESKITSKTVAILAVHIYGLTVDMDPLMAIAQKHHLAVIEDAAESIGGRYRSRPCGSFGTLSVFSFYANKHISTGEGGMVVTDDPHLAERCREFRNLCFQKQKRFLHKEMGWNYRMTNLQAAIGVAQMEGLSETLEAKKRIGSFYQKALADLPDLQLPLNKTEYSENQYWVFGLVFASERFEPAEELGKKLATKAVGTRPFFYPMHLQPVFAELGFFKGERYPVAEYLSRKGLYLPSGASLSEEQLNWVVKQVQELYDTQL